MKRAIICGHTGATGLLVLEQLVRADWISEIVTIGRRECQAYVGNEKVHQIIVQDMSDLSGLDKSEIGKVDIAFDLIATSVKDAFKGEEVYRKVDVDMTSEFAKLAHEAGARFLAAIGMTAAKEGANEYASKAKADFEAYARTLGFQRLAFMKPMWVDREGASKWYEKIYTMFSKNVTKASELSYCLVWAAQHQGDGEKSYSISEMRELSKDICRYRLL